MNKLEMAHQMACAMMASNDGYTIGGAMECAWEYADAMQKEWDERENKEACGHDWNETTSNGDKYRFFVCKNCDATRNFEPIEEWQPDWSQAPSEYKWYAVDENGNNGFFVMKPYKSLVSNIWRKDENDFSAFIHLGYLPISKTDNWQDSLRKRP